MSYVQIEIGGKLRGLKFNQGALMMFHKMCDFDNLEATAAYALFWAGLKSNAYAKREELTKEVDGKEEPVTYEDVCDWVDNVPDDVQLQVNKAWEESGVYKNKIQPALDDIKKNLSQGTSTQQNVTESDAVD